MLWPVDLRRTTTRSPAGLRVNLFVKPEIDQFKPKNLANLASRKLVYRSKGHGNLVGNEVGATVLDKNFLGELVSDDEGNRNFSQTIIRDPNDRCVDN